MSYYKLLNKGTETFVEVSANSIEKLFSVSFKSWLETVSDQNNYGLENKTFEISSDNYDSLLKEFMMHLNLMLNSKKWVTIEIHDLLIIKKDEANFYLSALFRGKDINSVDVRIKKIIKSIVFNGRSIDFDSGYFSTKFVYEL